MLSFTLDLLVEAPKPQGGIWKWGLWEAACHEAGLMMLVFLWEDIVLSPLILVLTLSSTRWGCSEMVVCNQGDFTRHRVHSISNQGHLPQVRGPQHL